MGWAAAGSSTAVLSAAAVALRGALALAAVAFCAPGWGLAAIFGFRAHQLAKALGQRRWVQLLLTVGLDRFHRGVQRVEAGEHGVDGVAGEGTAALAQQLEDFLHLVRELGDLVEAHGRAHPLQRVRDPEDLLERRPILGVLLEAHDGEVELLQVLAGLREEHRHVLGVVHQPFFLKMKGWAETRSRAFGSATRSVAPTIK